MKKSNFVALIMGTVSGVFFALGMCMALLPEWGMRNQGIVSGAIGLVLMLITVGIWRKMEGKAPVKISGKTIGATLLGVLGALLLGVGMCLSMVFEDDSWHRHRHYRHCCASHADPVAERLKIS